MRGRKRSRLLWPGARSAAAWSFKLLDHKCRDTKYKSRIMRGAPSWKMPGRLLATRFCRHCFLQVYCALFQAGVFKLAL